MIHYSFVVRSLFLSFLSSPARFRFYCEETVEPTTLQALYTLDVSSGSSDITLHEVNEASALIHTEAHEDVNIIFGAVIDEKMGEEVRVTVIATGFGKEENKRIAAIRNIAPAVIVGDMDIPTIIRREKRSEMGAAEVRRLKPLGGFNATDEDAYDTPTFLRKQAD
ncbi:MAG: hypothetical protein HY026_11110 [Deltaproteobacteria bacterium]|nr:hypothetical protein [Deltaproteobacteria bacterium]